MDEEHSSHDFVEKHGFIRCRICGKIDVDKKTEQLAIVNSKKRADRLLSELASGDYIIESICNDFGVYGRKRGNNLSESITAERIDGKNMYRILKRTYEA